MTYVTVNSAQKADNQVNFDYFESEDEPRPNTPPQRVFKHSNCKMVFRTPRDAQSFYDILIMAIDKWEITDR